MENSTKSSLSVMRPLKFRVLRVVSVFLLIVALILACLRPMMVRHFESVECGNQMSSIGVAARLWSNDNKGRLPPDLRSLQAELVSTRILICPSEHSGRATESWTAFLESQCSYEIIPRDASDRDANKPFIRCKIHGHLGYPDGTVFDGKARRGKKNW
jgi:hypothetical protein